jgi:uncharacterized LabA/DUF88 family protein
MTTQALFVDLPNFYSHLLESGVDDPRQLRDYFLYWFDFDRLSQKLTGEFSSVWIFYSGRKFGPRTNRIEGEYLDKYIERTNILRGVTARDVDIEGRQRETAIYQCEKCSYQGVAQWESEKGIDASLTVHLFDTMDTWDVAYLLSGDADFVPVVASLRRRGKIVIGAGFSNRSAALVRECYDYVDLWDVFFREDVFAYHIFAEDGIARKWLTDEVQCQPSNAPVELTFEWQFRPEHISIYLTAKGHVDLSSRLKQIEDLRSIFPGGIRELNPSRGEYQLIITTAAWSGVERRLEKFIPSLQGLQTYEAHYSGKGYSAKYEYSPNTKKYEPA